MRAPSLFALLLLAPVASAEQAPRPVPRPGLSWAEAEALDRKLTAIEKQRVVAPRKSRPETVTVTESELNSDPARPKAQASSVVKGRSGASSLTRAWKRWLSTRNPAYITG